MSHNIVNSNELYDLLNWQTDGMEHKDISLFHGMTGDLLLLYDLYELTSDQSVLDKISRLFFKLKKSFDSCHSFNFRDGYAGVLYVCSLLHNRHIVTIDSELFDVFDVYFLQQIEQLTKINDYELLHGIIGYGIYYIERARTNPKKRYYVYRIIENLLNMAIKQDGCRMWVNIAEKHPLASSDEIWIYWGFLHGVPSVLSFFLICIKEGYCPDGLIEETQKCLSFLLRLKERNGDNFVFCDSLLINGEKKRILPPVYHNLYYCNGDLGIMNLLSEAGCVLGQTFYREESHKIFNKCFNQFSVGYYYHSFCMCHGWSSFLFFLNKFQGSLSKPAYEKSKELLINKIVEELKIQKYPPGILTGYTGMFFSLLSSYIPTSLNRLLLLS